MNDTAYEGWKSVNIKRNLGAIAGAFSLSIVEAWGGQILPNQPCQVLLNNSPVITGYTDKNIKSISANANTFKIEGRDLTGQFVDCSAIYKTGSWKNAKIDKIIRDLISPFGIPVKFSGDLGNDFSKFVIQQGETVFESIERACKARGLVPTSDFEGNLVITDQTPKKSNDSLIYGKNIKSANQNLTGNERFSKYIVKGSVSGDNWSPNKSYNIKTETLDETVELYRPLIIIPEGQTDTAAAQARGDFEASIRAAKASEISIETVGWSQENGDLWDVNLIVPVDIPNFGISEELLITECSYNLDSGGGEITKFKLMREDAFKKLTQKKVKKRPQTSSFGW